MTHELFIDASDIIVDKPQPKKRRINASNCSTNEGSEAVSEVLEDDEDGAYVDSEQEVEEECNIDTFAELLSDYKALKREIMQLKSKQTDSMMDSVQSIVRDVVKHMVTDIKQQIVSDLNMDGVNSAMRTYVKKMNINSDKTEKIEKQIDKLSQRDNPIPVDRVTNDVVERVKSVEHKVVDLEARSKRNNLVFHGVDESPDENCMDVAFDLIERGCCVDRHVTLERAHRIGDRKRGHQNRPLIVKFLDFQDKVAVQRGKKNLPQRISVSDDLPQPIRIARKCLIQQLKDEKKAGHAVYIRYPATLMVNGEAVRTEPIQPVTRTVPSSARPVDRPAQNHKSNEQDFRVNSDEDEQTIPHMPWSTAGSQGKHRHVPERQGSRRPENRENRYSFNDNRGAASRGQTHSRHNNRNDNNNNNNGTDRGQPLWVGEARRQLDQQNNTRSERRYRHRDSYTRQNKIPVEITEEREDGELSDGSLYDDGGRDFCDQHSKHGRFGGNTGASSRQYGNRGGQRDRRGAQSQKEDRQGSHNRRM